MVFRERKKSFCWNKKHRNRRGQNSEFVNGTAGDTQQPVGLKVIKQSCAYKSLFSSLLATSHLTHT